MYSCKFCRKSVLFSIALFLKIEEARSVRYLSMIRMLRLQKFQFEVYTLKHTLEAAVKMAYVPNIRRSLLSNEHIYVSLICRAKRMFIRFTECHIHHSLYSIIYWYRKFRLMGYKVTYHGFN